MLIIRATCKIIQIQKLKETKRACLCSLSLEGVSLSLPSITHSFQDIAAIFGSIFQR